MTASEQEGPPGGERDRSPASDPGLIRLARGLARSHARRHPALRRHEEDLEAAALLGLAEAARSFDPGRGLTFSALAGHRMRGAILDEIRRIGAGGFAGAQPLVRRGRPGPACTSLDRTRAESAYRADRPVTLAEAIPSGDLPVGWEIESEDEVRRALGPFGAPGALLIDRFLRADRATLRAAARARGRCQSWASHFGGRVLGRLRSDLQARGRTA